jgi:hypothetical protein
VGAHDREVEGVVAAVGSRLLLFASLRGESLRTQLFPVPFRRCFDEALRVHKALSEFIQ